MWLEWWDIITRNLSLYFFSLIFSSAPGCVSYKILHERVNRTETLNLSSLHWEISGSSKLWKILKIRKWRKQPGQNSPTTSDTSSKNWWPWLFLTRMLLRNEEVNDCCNVGRISCGEWTTQKKFGCGMLFCF